MSYEIQEAKELVVKAGKELIEKGLIARTWGNVSARISDTQFVITPSGRAYEDLTPEEIVVVNIDDCSYEGDIKPSSEKGVHAAAYRHHPTVDFVIHTHQKAATIVSITGMEIRNVYDEFKPVLGEKVPCAAYAMSTTDSLRKKVEMCIMMNPNARAIMMMHHGTVCMGDDYDHAFALAENLEKCCEKVIKDNYLRHSWAKTYSDEDKRNYFLNKKDAGTMPDEICDLGTSVRNGKTFTLTVGGKSVDVDVESGVGINGIPPKVEKLHRAIYNTEDVTFIRQLATPDVVAVSCTGDGITPMIDDFAQIVGTDVKNVAWIDGDTDDCAKAAGEAIDQRNAVLVEGAGALITGNTEGDLQALEIIMDKACQAVIDVDIFNRAHYVPKLECMLMRTVYLAKYSKKIDEK
ncbi:MAG: class II aldolase/adducin family protein [Eubacterium sp.]|nr:class II aldolase/adducin family protein [Eubacterium sp.]MBR1531507.1 class II aldolase/adducin family protein [Eubacterium sp.]MBR2278183.1 class II aldolase/adducin family protein [Eubacterium sp.]